MEDCQTKPDEPVNKNNNQILEVEDEKDIVKEFVYQHFKEVSSQSTGLLYCDSDEILIEDSVSSNKTARKSSKKSRCKIQQGAVFSGKILSFGCSECKDDSTYSPNDLLKHFRGIHKGTLPTYPCDLCGFVTHEFPALQRHRIGHRNTLVTCEICNDNVQYSLLLLTRHYIMCHSMNGHFRCEKCEFSTLDAGTFVQHIHRHNETNIKCVKCQHVSSNKDEYQKHLKLHSGTFPFTCQICGYGAARKEYLTKHMVNIHSEETEKQSGWRAKEDCNNSLSNSSAGLKLLLKKSPSAGGESNESQWISKLNPVPGTLLDQNGRVTNPEKTGEENPSFLERVAGKKEAKKVSLNRELHASQAIVSMPSPSQETEGSGSDASGPNNANGLTVLMVKNKISLPPNCTTKVMGFKMVDGKKHLVLKVIPTAKMESSPQNMSAADKELGYKMSDNAFDLTKYTESTENKQTLYLDTPTSVRSGSSIQSSTSEIDEDLVTKIKHEPEESLVNESILGLQKEGSTEVKSLNFNDSAHKRQLHSNSVTTCVNIDQNPSGLKCLTCPSRHDKTSSVQSSMRVGACSPVLKSSGGKRCGATKKNIDFVTDSQKDISVTEEKHAFVSKKLIQKSASNSNCLIKETEDKAKCKSPCLNTKLNLLPEHSNNLNETESCMDKCAENSPNQEVYSFHNYSKETSNVSLISNLPFDNSSELSAEDESVCDKSSPQWSLTLSASPQPLTEHCIETEPANGNLGTDQETPPCPVRDGEMEKVSDSDIEVDECIASVEDPSTSVQSDDENPESVFQDFNIIKIEEDSVPVSEKQTVCKSSSASLGRIVEEHSDAIISHQLEKERTGSSTAGMDIVRPTKTTLRILKTPEGKQKMFLHTRDRFAVPVQVQGNQGFKLLSKSSGPQINVSYMKPGIDRQSNPSALALTLNNGRLSMSRPTSSVSEKSASLLSAVQPGATKNHYFVNSSGLKGPLLLAGSTASNPVDKTIKTQPTCYLVQRPIPANSTSNTSFKLANSGPVSRQVLAMPVSSSDKSSPLQTGRQAFLVRYITPAKGASQSSQSSESTGNKVVFKIVRPAGGLLASGTSTSTGQPIFLTTRPQTQCFLVASNKANTNTQTGVKQLFPIQSSAHQPVKLSYILSPQAQHVRLKQHEGEKPSLAPRPIRPPSQRKRRRKALFDELPEPMPKTRRVASKTLIEKESPSLWKPVTKDVEKTLRLCPFSSLQLIKCPRQYQPVVVLNHPDADIPEVCTIMKSVNRFKGAVSRVSLSRKTVQALSKLCQAGVPEPRPIENTLRERFLLKLKLRKKSKKKYEVVDSLVRGGEQPSIFECWFCGRLFNSQEEWIGHGQRHLMEATRDWNKLF